MVTTALPAKAPASARILSWPRVRGTLWVSVPVGLMMASHWKSAALAGLVYPVLLGISGATVFGLFERWPKRLPRRLARWVLQVVAVGMAMPITTWWIFTLFTVTGAPSFWDDPVRKTRFNMLCGVATFIAPWTALTALVRQKDALARHQAVAFQLERSELERQALDARLRLLQAQIAPHFLFNTLANVQALVDAGSPQASDVLRSLVAYLRAAVPRLNEPVSTLSQELQLVQAYLELMHMRIPDRLQFSLHVDDAARNLRCPPMTLLTLVENSVRHGIDPSEEGGAIEIHVQRRGGRCLVRVSDTGAGLGQKGGGLGTGLTTLRERLQLTFGGDAQIRVSAQQPRGVTAEVDFPAREG